jgi:hypothetical protein
MKSLIECLAEAGARVPFTVKVAKGGGEYREGDVLNITRVSHRERGEHQGQVQYDFTNTTRGTTHRNWRHDSDALFTLTGASATGEIPADILAIINESEENEGFGCYTNAVKNLVGGILKHLATEKKTA